MCTCAGDGGLLLDRRVLDGGSLTRKFGSIAGFNEKDLAGLVQASLMPPLA